MACQGAVRDVCAGFSVAILVLAQVMRFVIHNQGEVAGLQFPIVAEVGIRGNNDTLAGVLLVLELVDAQAQVRGVLNPVFRFGICRNDNQNIFVAGHANMTVYDAQAGIGFTCACAVGEQNAMLAGIEAVFRLQHVLMLFAHEIRQGLADIIEIRRLDLDAVGLVLKFALGF